MVHLICFFSRYLISNVGYLCPKYFYVPYQVGNILKDVSLGQVLSPPKQEIRRLEPCQDNHSQVLLLSSCSFALQVVMENVKKLFIDVSLMQFVNFYLFFSVILMIEHSILLICQFLT